MSINFDIDKDDDDLITDDEQVKDEKDDDGLKKTLFKFAILIGGGLIIILLLLFITSLFSEEKTKTYSFEEIEEILENAAISYFKDNPSQLPSEEGKIVRIEDTTLVMTGKMKNLSQYTKEGTNCTGVVDVSKSGNKYTYVPKLSCGDAYSSTSLVEEVINTTVSSGYGLYKMNNEYVFRGEKVDNFVQLENSLWRIVKVTPDKNIVLINEAGYNINSPWDDRYNENAKYNAGINNYSTSRIRESLYEIYNESTENSLLSANDKTKMVNFSVCVGKRTLAEVKNDNSVECAKKLADQRIAPLAVADYINASTDSNCTSIESKSCQNYNYLSNNKKWWLVTSKTDTSYVAFYVDSNGTVKESSTSNYFQIRPVIHLNSSVVLNGGDGTKENPYTIK